MSKILGAVIITYFRDIEATLGIPIAVLVYCDPDDVEMHIRKDWQPVLAYDEVAELGFLQSVVQDGLDSFEHSKTTTWLTSLTGAELDQGKEAGWH